ncbi:hypothetical protein GCM10010151_27770 [Actinoallomurus spadix]|uniref:Uncharacterized protein n=1 Tax=Actinoallomurus spadix TaxID=79912 RepID=A0ABP3G5D7_9ACTN
MLDLPLFVGEPVREDHLFDGDVAAEGFISGVPDRPHAATAYFGEQAVTLGKKGFFRHSPCTIPTGGAFIWPDAHLIPGTKKECAA